MAQQFWLGRQDGPGGINLLDRGRITVRHQGFSAPTPAPGLRERVVTLNLRLSGPTVGDWQAARAEIDRALGAIDPAPLNRRYPEDVLVLSVTLDGEHWTYIDVKRGSLEVTELLPRGRDAFATLTLTCLPLLRTDAVQAMNLLASPTDPTAAAWTRTNVTATAANAVAPDGSLTAATLLETTATGAHEIVQQITTAAAAGQYTLSCYVKANGRAAAALYLADGSGANGVYGGYDLAGGTLLYPAGTAGSGWSGASATITDAGDGWWRIALTGTSNAATTLRCYVQLHNGAGTAYAGDAAKGVRVWGAQLEEGATAGLLLVPTYHPDTVRQAYTIAGYTLPATPATYANDPDNLIAAPTTWTANNSTETASQADPAGGTASSKFVAGTNNSTHYARTSQATVSTGANTAAIYLKQNGSSSSKVRVLFSGLNTGTGYVVTVDFAAGSVSAPTLVGGTGYSGASSEIIDLGGGWFWLRITQTMTGTSSATIYVTFADSNPATTYTGTANHGVQTWRAQIVAGGTIDEPVPPEPEEVIDPVDVPAETVATGKPAGAYLFGIPGDAPALYRLELEDASADGAVNRVHIGAWSGDGVRLGEIAPFRPMAATERASDVSDGDGHVGESYVYATVDPAWAPIAAMVAPQVVADRGLIDIWARVRDQSPTISAPATGEITAVGGTYAKRVARVADTTNALLTSFGIGRRIVTPGSTLVLAAQGLGMSVAMPSWSIAESGGITWTLMQSEASHQSSVAVWYAENVPQTTGPITLAASGSGVQNPVITLLELRGVAASSFESSRKDAKYIDRTWAGATEHTSGALTNTQAHALYFSIGLGLRKLMVPVTVTENRNWQAVSSLDSGAIAYLPVTTSAARTVKWIRPQMMGQPETPESWLVITAVFKAASATGSSLTAGEWSLCMTALDAAGNESLPSPVRTVGVPSTTSSVAVEWSAPLVGTPDTYRIYRNNGGGWGYVEVPGTATSYLFTSESGVTVLDPPTKPPPTAAFRLAVALPSGTTLWRAQETVSLENADGQWREVYLGMAPWPPIPDGEGEMPEGAVMLVEAAHEAHATVAVNGAWVLDADRRQVVAEREGMNAAVPVSWVLDGNRDEIVSAALIDPATGDDAGQPILTAAGMTCGPGNVQLVIRPTLAGEASDLVAADLRLTRVLVTPRYRYLRGRS